MSGGGGGGVGGGVSIYVFYPSMPTKVTVQFNLFDGEWLKQACPKILFI